MPSYLSLDIFIDPWSSQFLKLRPKKTIHFSEQRTHFFASKGGGLLLTYVLWLEIHQLLFNWSQSTSFPGSLILPWEWGCKSMVTYSFKPRPNDRNMSTQHIATLLGPTCCVFGHRVVMCCNMLGVVGSNLTSFRLEPTTANMSQHGGQTHATCCAQ